MTEVSAGIKIADLKKCFSFNKSCVQKHGEQNWDRNQQDQREHGIKVFVFSAL